MSKGFTDPNILQDIIDQLEQQYVYYIENVAFTSDYIITKREGKVTPQALEEFIKGLED